MLWDLLLGLIFLGALRYGDYITYECPQRGYACPIVCDVDHKHYPRKECKNASREGNIWEEGRKTSNEKEGEKENCEEDSSQEEVLTGE